MKKLWGYLKDYKMESILAPLFKLLEVVFDLLVPVVVARKNFDVVHSHLTGNVGNDLNAILKFYSEHGI